MFHGDHLNGIKSVKCKLQGILSLWAIGCDTKKVHKIAENLKGANVVMEVYCNNH
jgi:hypothetical protein